MKRSSHLAVAALLAIAILPAISNASIAGFGNFSNFTVNQTDSGPAPTVNVGAGSIRLTHEGGDSRSIFDNSPQDITNFTASFTYQEANGTTNSGLFGVFFVLQNSGGPSAVASTNYGRYGYSDFTDSFGNSAGIGLEYEGSGTPTYTGLYMGGSSGGGNSTAPVNFLSGDPINVTITYNGTIVEETLLDATTSASYSDSYLANLKSDAGGSTAFIGFTAGTGNPGTVDQTISNFQFTNTAPEPSGLSLLAIASLTLFRRPNLRRNCIVD